MRCEMHVCFCRVCNVRMERRSHWINPRCRDCYKKARRQKDEFKLRRLEARRYRIIMHVLGWEHDQFEEMLVEMRRSPMAFRNDPETRQAKVDLTIERHYWTRERNRLLAAYAEGVDIQELMARYGRSQDAINQMARRHGVTRPDGYTGTRILGDLRLPLKPGLRVS